LRPDAKFSDGSPLTSNDVKTTLDLARGGQRSVWKDNYKAIKEIQAPDDKTVKIVLSQPYAPLLSTLAMFPSGVMPADMAKESDKEGFDPTKTRGSGAYMLDGWKKGEPMVLKRNPNYWKGALGPDTVQIEYVADDNSRILKLQGGEVDVIDFVPLSQIQSLNAQGTVKAQAFVIQQFDALITNTEKKPLDDVKVRQALNYALDKDAIIKTVYFGQAKPMTSPIPPGTYWDKTLQGYPFNLDKAKQLMAESSSPSGFAVDLTTRSGNVVYQQIATIAKDQWSKIGVTVNVQQLETSLQRTSYREGKHSITQGSWTNDMNDPTEIVNYEMRGGASPFAYWTRYNNPDLNDKITKADLEQDPKKREQLYAEIQKIYLDAAPLIFIAYPPATAAWQKYVDGFFIDGLSYYRFEDVKVNK
jgi:peptide/nickel transport system substrate-binding protein